MVHATRLPPPRRKPLAVALPLSYAATEHTLMLKTLKWGILARYAAVYRVTHILLYKVRSEPLERSDRELAETILRYLVVAPYLRRRVIPRTPLLRYAGVLPPLQLPTHGAGGPTPGECRQALVLRKTGNRATLEAGLGRPLWVPARQGLEEGSIVLVEIEEVDPPRLRIGCRSEPYNGYLVETYPSLRGLLSRWRRVERIATSRLGVSASPSLLREAAERYVDRGLLFIFGSPWRGLYEIASEEGFNLDDVARLVLNTVPGQGTKTVRVEEAIAATLSLFNLYACLVERCRN